MADLTPVFLEPEWPVEPLHIVGIDGETCWCSAGHHELPCPCEFCLDYNLEDKS